MSTRTPAQPKLGELTDKTKTKLIRKKLGEGDDDETFMLTNLNLNPTPKKNDHGKLRRSYAILDIAAVSDAAKTDHEGQVSNDGYEPPSRPESQASDEIVYVDEPTPKKKQKKIKVPVRETINANRMEYEPREAANKVSSSTITWRWHW